MKKIIICITLVSCLLISSIVSVNALNIQTTNENNEQNPLRNILDKKDIFNTIKQDDNLYSGNSLSTDFDGNIFPAYFNTWGEEYLGCWPGVKTTVYDGYLYQPVRVDTLVYDEWMGILKYNASDGSLCDFEIYYDNTASCLTMIILDNYLYISGLNYDAGYSLIVKYNISGDSINFEQSLTLPYYYLIARNICTDGYNIYICGDDATNDSLLLQKYNTDLEPIWIEPKTWNRPYEDECWGMTFYDGSIFLTGVSSDDNSINSFVLKFDSDGNLLEETIGLNDNLVGCVIKGYEGKIYVVYGHVNKFPPNIDFQIVSYTTDLVNIWTSEHYDYCNYDQVTDIVIVEDYIYMGGFVWGIDWMSGMASYLNSFILKVDISNGEKIWWKVVDAPGTEPGAAAMGICADESNLYLSGAYWENYAPEEATDVEAYILKCDFNGNPSSEHPNVPEISGSNSGEINVEYDYTY